MCASRASGAFATVCADLRHVGLADAQISTALGLRPVAMARASGGVFFRAELRLSGVSASPSSVVLVCFPLFCVKTLSQAGPTPSTVKRSRL
jgi:hypothetical protein